MQRPNLPTFSSHKLSVMVSDSYKKSVFIYLRHLVGSDNQKDYEEYITKLNEEGALVHFLNYPQKFINSPFWEEKDAKFLAKVLEDASLFLNYKLDYEFIFRNKTTSGFYKKYLNPIILKGIRYSVKSI